MNPQPAAFPLPRSAPAASVLVADDNPSVRQLVRVVLERAGREVVAVEDGFEAGILMERRAFDAVVTDIKMPRRSGLGVVADARRLQLAMRVIAMSGDWAEGSLDFRQALEQLGVRAFLTKPFAIGELLALIDSDQSLPSPADPHTGGKAVA
jgi:CheY-like chemotaxis protein